MTNYTAEQIKQLADEYADVYMFYGGKVTPDPRKSLHDAIDDLLREREVPEETISDELDAHRGAARELTNVLIGADALHITADGGTEAAWKNIIQSVKDLLRERESSKADAAVLRAVMNSDLYQVLMDVQNGIDSPALMSLANRAIQLLDKARAAIAAQQQECGK